MRINVITARRGLDVSLPELRRLAAWLSKNIPEFDAAAWAEVSVVVTDDAGIAEMNESFLKHKGPTDVITFTLDPLPGETRKRGEIYVNVDRAALEAKRRGIEPARELAFYVAHGFDHLSGSDDRTKAMRARMHRRERAWLKIFFWSPRTA